MWHKGVRWYHVKSDILKEGPGTKYPWGWEIAKCKIPSVKMLFKSNTNGHKHPSINLCYVYRRISISMRTLYMMASPNGNIFRVTVFYEGNPRGGHRWIPFTKASDAELWYFLWTSPEQTIEQTT